MNGLFQLSSFGLYSSVVVAAVALAGCENPCVAVCTDQTECEGADVAVNCETQCETEKENAEAIDCLSQYEDAIDCQSGVDDVCAIGDECVEQIETFQKCFGDACIEDPDNEACQT